jgi:hypothetical protein
MKHKRPIILIIFGILLLVWTWYYTAPPPPGPHYYSIATQKRFKSEQKARMEKRRAEGSVLGRMPHMVGGFVPMTTDSYVEVPETNDIEPAPAIDPKYTNSANWPNDSRAEVRSVYAFAKIARLYKFDPVVTSSTDSLRFQKMVGTATYSADIDTRNGHIEKMSSRRDRSGSIGDYPGVTEEWANATGKWHERQMVEETFRILRELGYTETLKVVSQGWHKFSPSAWRVKLPEGGFKIVYPFATVELYGPNVTGDPHEPPRVTAEYRMGPDGPVGLVDWFSLY